MLSGPAGDGAQQLGGLRQVDRDIEDRGGRSGRFRNGPPVTLTRLSESCHLKADGTPPDLVARSSTGRMAAVSDPDITVIVRARDEERTIGRCLALLAGQEVGERSLETIVVDNGSRDRTAANAAAAGARIVPIPREPFSFGAALNRGAEAARGSVLVALSADAFASDPGWISRLCRHLADDRVACASGDPWAPDGSPLRTVVRQDLSLVRAHPRWGYSNGAGAFRAELWRRRAFREDLPGCEDQEWALHWLGEGYICVIDPALVIDHDHAHDPVPVDLSPGQTRGRGFCDVPRRRALRALGARPRMVVR